MIRIHAKTNENVHREVEEEIDFQEEEEEMNDVDNDIGSDSKGKENEGESDLCDSSYRFSDDSEDEPIEKSETNRCVVIVYGEPSRVACEDDVESDYAGSEELNSCMLLNRWGWVNSW